MADSQTPDGRSPRDDDAVAVAGPLADEIRFPAQRLRSTVAWTHFHHRRDIEAVHLRAIQQAKAEIILARAYFLPEFDCRQAIAENGAQMPLGDAATASERWTKAWDRKVLSLQV